ncbi:C40 family peptidase [Roseicyclus mahoneyensis]|uniref:NlpC/P60 family protein n=1 Tax=Roseicyclus mahoneyensis TaxID=164332 RepID=A0A316GFS0_9RHOB|nr:C40 family peptidase [Roseicyclus mahoneyensis]PWK59837.1 NlpC/P60 family protein [Roseicyclus mahoneyensis]
MTLDPRVTPSNGRVAHVSLEGEVEAERFVKGRWMMVQQPMVNITDTPRGARVSQLLFGERFLALETDEGFSFGMAERDGYCGYILSGALTGAEEATHWVVAPATHLYPKHDIKTAPDVALFFGSRVKVTGERDRFCRIQTGHYIPAQHLMPVKARFSDPVGIADLFLGTPYLWGGCSRWGIDCSGLVQAALAACGLDCPRDSDQQEASLGDPLPESAPLQRGDLVFWRGHVGIMANEIMLLHANAHHMAVAYEPLDEAVARIGAREFGDVTSIRRLPRLGAV